MTHTNDNDSKQLEFPIQEIDYETDSVSSRRLIQSIRVTSARLLNQIAAGEKTLDLEGYNALKGANEILLDNGFTPLIDPKELDSLI